METKTKPQPMEPVVPGQYVPTEVPVGTVVAFAGQVGSTSSPTATNVTNIESMGWMVCDGRSLENHKYPELFAALGYLYGGSGDRFNLPDYRGYFLRGIGNDDASLEDRQNAPYGKTDGVGSTQKDAVQTHKHLYTSPNDPTPVAAGKKDADVVNAINKTDLNGTPTDQVKIPGSVKVSNYETRPRNIFVNYIIRYSYFKPGNK